MTAMHVAADIAVSVVAAVLFVIIVAAWIVVRIAYRRGRGSAGWPRLAAPTALVLLPRAELPPGTRRAIARAQRRNRIELRRSLGR